MAISAVSFLKTPQAADDLWFYTEDELLLLGGSAQLILDVMANDTGGKAKTLFSIDDGAGNPINPADLLNVDGLVNGVSAWETTSGGNSFRINNGKIELNLDPSLAALGGSINSLAAGDHIHDSFIYAIRLGNGTLSWARVTFDLYGQNDAATISGNNTGTLGEDDTSPVTGTLTVVDPDHGQSFVQSVVNGTTVAGLGTYSVDVNGNWSYVVDNAAVQYLATGETASDSFVVVSADGTASETVTITITGEDEGPPVLLETVYASPGTAQVKVADLNGDGYSDIAFCVPGASQIRILLNNGDGSFHSAPVAIAPSSETLSIADMNGDNILDLVSGNTFANNIGVHLGNGDGTFQTPTAFGAGSVIPSIVTYDFNEDGNLDVASSSYYDGAISILLGNGNGTLQPRYTVPVGAITNYGIAVGDFGNGHGDIVLIKIDTQQIHVLLGDGLGNFTQGTTLTTGENPVFVSVADLGDGNQDIMVGNLVSNDIFVFRGNGDGTFQVAQSYDVGSGPYNVVTADMNNDGTTDLVTGNNGSNSISVLIGNGDETFQTAQDIAVSGSPVGLAVSDFNGDGFVDVSYGDGSGLHVLLNVQDFLV